VKVLRNIEDRQFDYSGSQCLKALNEDDIESILINPNVATIQTDSRFADRVYLLPVTTHYVRQIIEQERPDSIMLGFGGQTALNCGVALEKEGVLKKYGIKVLGTQIEGIQVTEDRQLFKNTMTECGLPVLESASSNSVEDSLLIAKRIGYPVIIRVAYTLGGKGGGVAFNEYELQEIVQRGLSQSVARQVLIERYVGSWKQIEYEVMRDQRGNCVIVCNMENVLAMRVHTGDNIVVAPSQTLNNYEYHMLRHSAMTATRKCDIVGECNIQFGLDPRSENFCVIEVNARLSRSSALASKATGYPLAYMAAKISLGYSLPELINTITKATTACFEPSLDYVVLKIPRWDFKKFELVKRRLGSSMKSIGEVMAIGRSFEEALQKGIRMCDNGRDGLVSNSKFVNSGLRDTRDVSIDVSDGNDTSGKNSLTHTELRPLSFQEDRLASQFPLSSNPAKARSNFEEADTDRHPLGSSTFAYSPDIDNPSREQSVNVDEIEIVEQCLLYPTDEILFDVAKALTLGVSVNRINELSSIDTWFLGKIQVIVEMEQILKTSSLDKGVLLEAKKMGFSDLQIGRCAKMDELGVRNLRKKFSILPVVKQIDTLAAEWPAKTNYLYLTYGGRYDDVRSYSRRTLKTPIPETRRKISRTNQDYSRVIVLGAGPYRIGSSVEFDWGTVNMVWGLKENGCKEVAIINCNPETVSTDYDVCDRLYFEELTFERVMDICEREKCDGIVTCVGGQTANILTPRLDAAKIRIVGTSAESVDKAEDRSKFGKLLDDLGIRQPAWKKFTSLNEARSFAKEVRYPLLVRPSYVLSGAAMKITWAEDQLTQYLTEATNVSPDHPIVISKFLEDASEAEVDGVGDGENVVIGSVIEHIENAGVHSGDAIMCIPPWRLDRETIDTITDYSLKIGRALKIIGPFNIQFLVKKGRVYVIEANVRASRSMPFVSKFVGLNLITLAAKAMVGKKIPVSRNDIWISKTGFGIKVPQFSFMQLEGADIVLGVEMQSTGEAACFGLSFHDALSKAYVAAGFNLPLHGSALITVGGTTNKERILPLVQKIADMGYSIMATEHTADFIEKFDICRIERVYKISEPQRRPNISEMLFGRQIDFIINIPSTSTIEKYVGMLYDEYQIRRKAVELGIPVLTAVESAATFINTLDWIRKNTPTTEYLKPYRDL
jgi:carbamoylphosphate synthase large subunit